MFGVDHCGTNRVPEASASAGAGINSAVVLTGRIGEFGFYLWSGTPQGGPPADDPAQDQRPSSMDASADSAISQLSARGGALFSKPSDLWLAVPLSAGGLSASRTTNRLHAPPILGGDVDRRGGERRMPQVLLSNLDRHARGDCMARAASAASSACSPL